MDKSEQIEARKREIIRLADIDPDNGKDLVVLAKLIGEMIGNRAISPNEIELVIDKLNQTTRFYATKAWEAR